MDILYALAALVSYHVADLFSQSVALLIWLAVVAAFLLAIALIRWACIFMHALWKTDSMRAAWDAVRHG